ncbi:MAG: carboxypeptidase-like regulatory domain-containing protein [Terriglobia bacterium]
MSTFLLPLLFLFAAPAQQTPTPNPADLCTIQGVVVKAGTGEPLRKATVQAFPAANRIEKEESQGGIAETDATGRFKIKGLPPGRYRLTAERNGFVVQWYGQHTPAEPGATVILSAGEKIPDVTFQLIPAGVITGHVYDQDGEPVVYASVEAMQYAYVNGQRQLVRSLSGQTNDLGEFRIFGLSPGQYYVQAILRPRHLEDVKSKHGYVPAYYPGVSDVGRAAPIAVRGGDEFSGIDISLQSVHGLTVKGNVINAGCEDTVGGAMVYLLNAYQNLGWMNPPRSANAQGTFEISGVTPGSYYLYAMLIEEGGRQCFGRQALEVGDADIDGVTLAVAPGVEIKGRLRVEGQTDSDLGSLTVSLLPKTAFMPFGGGGYAPAKSDGTFLIKNAYDGDYEINVANLPENYFVKSARLDGVDVLAAGVTVDSKQAPGSLEIVVNPNGASVDGMISKDQQPFQGATVVLVPDPPHRGEKRLFKSITTDQNGHFVLQGLPPGDYKVFAWEKIEHGAYTIPEVLAPYESLGESVHITEGARNTVQLDLIPTKDSNP